MKRVAVAGFFHETNTFSPAPTDLAAFKRQATLPGLTIGEAMITRFAGLNVPVTGAMTALREAGHGVVPVAWASAVPGGMVTREAFETISGIIIDGIAAARADGVYLDLHGAMVSQDHADAEAELLRRVRLAVGLGIPVVASFDLHANLTAEIVAEIDGIAVFETYPHLDMAQTGTRAAVQLLRLLRERRPVARAIRKLPFLVPLHAQCTHDAAPATIYAAVQRLRASPAIAGACFAFGFPPADFAGCGPAAVVIGSDMEEVNETADAIERLVLAAEPDLDVPLLAPDEAILAAMACGSGPAVIADTQDNPGAGGSGDTIGMLAALTRCDATNAAFAILHDPAAVALAHELGAGRSALFRLGGCSGAVAEPPLALDCTVETLADGEITATGPMYRGNRWSIGRTCLLRHRGIAIMVAEKRLQCADQAVLRHVGLEPASLGIIVIKSSVHFRADFEGIAKRVIMARSPGLHLADNRGYRYRHLPEAVRRMPAGLR